MKEYNKARIESMSNRIQELEAHLEILEKQLELMSVETKINENEIYGSFFLIFKHTVSNPVRPNPVGNVRIETI